MLTLNFKNVWYMLAFLALMSVFTLQTVVIIANKLVCSQGPETCHRKYYYIPLLLVSNGRRDSGKDKETSNTAKTV